MRLSERILSIDVTADDIKHGIPKNSNKCALALAVTRFLSELKLHNPYENTDYPAFLRVVVVADTSQLVCRCDGETTVYSLSLEARQLVRNFDEGLPVEPCSVKIFYHLKY